MKLYELTIEDENVDEVFAISLVENPAIEANFIFFGKEEVLFATISNEKRMIIAPILIPEKKIIRVDAAGEPYEVYFTKDTVAKLAQNYLMKGYQHNSTLEHDGKIKDVTLVESWVKESKLNDKSNAYGLNLPVGSWVGLLKINNDDIWNNYVKTGKVLGVSIEGAFEHQLIKASNEVTILQKDIKKLSEMEASVVLKKLKKMLEAQPSVASSYPGEVASGSVSPALFEEGVPHYTKDGKLYTGPTHKDAEGRLMTGEVHSQISRYLYHNG